MRCIECDCNLVRDHKCPHDCYMCRDIDEDNTYD